MPSLLNLADRVAHVVVFSESTRALGDRMRVSLRWALNGWEISEFFHAVGLPSTGLRADGNDADLDVRPLQVPSNWERWRKALKGRESPPGGGWRIRPRSNVAGEVLQPA